MWVLGCGFIFKNGNFIMAMRFFTLSTSKRHLQCPLPNCFETEDQQHILKCVPLLEKLDKGYPINHISYNDIFANTKKQKKVTEVMIALLDIKKSILNKNQGKTFYY